MVANLALYWELGHKEPWYLAASLSGPKLAVKMYRLRMQPDSTFGMVSNTWIRTQRR